MKLTLVRHLFGSNHCRLYNGAVCSKAELSDVYCNSGIVDPCIDTYLFIFIFFFFFFGGGGGGGGGGGAVNY